tara:strand:+ start:126 stop:1109 length:984 start_codon:yes stop_codon:yes gene_type:complete
MNESINNIRNKIASILKLSKIEEVEKLILKVIAGREITNAEELSSWVEKRLKPNLVFISKNEYTEACIDALKMINTVAATDYGTSRQRDKLQLWADITRGYLGEICFQKFLLKKFAIQSTLEHKQGNVSDFLSSDISMVKNRTDTKYRSPKKNICIKTTKWNGIWLDIPGNQFSHSDMFVQVKINAGRDHLLGYMNELSIFKDKILKEGVSIGVLDDNELELLSNNLPKFSDISISGYICGYVLNKKYKKLSYKGKKGRKNFTIHTWCGPYYDDDIEKIKSKECLDSETSKVKFEGIGQFSSANRYLFNSGSLLYREEDWRKVLDYI